MRWKAHLVQANQIGCAVTFREERLVLKPLPGRSIGRYTLQLAVSDI